MKTSTAIVVNSVAVRLAARNAKKRARQEMTANMIIDGLAALKSDIAGVPTALTQVKDQLQEFVLVETARKTEEKVARQAAKAAQKEQENTAKVTEQIESLKTQLADLTGVFAPPTVEA